MLLIYPDGSTTPARTLRHWPSTFPTSSTPSAASPTAATASSSADTSTFSPLFSCDDEPASLSSPTTAASASLPMSILLGSSSRARVYSCTFRGAPHVVKISHGKGKGADELEHEALLLARSNVRALEDDVVRAVAAFESDDGRVVLVERDGGDALERWDELTEPQRCVSFLCVYAALASLPRGALTASRARALTLSPSCTVSRSSSQSYACTSSRTTSTGTSRLGTSSSHLSPPRLPRPRPRPRPLRLPRRQSPASSTLVTQRSTSSRARAARAPRCGSSSVSWRSSRSSWTRSGVGRRARGLCGRRRGMYVCLCVVAIHLRRAVLSRASSPESRTFSSLERASEPTSEFRTGREGRTSSSARRRRNALQLATRSPAPRELNSPSCSSSRPTSGSLSLLDRRRRRRRRRRRAVRR